MYVKCVRNKQAPHQLCQSYSPDLIFSDLLIFTTIPRVRRRYSEKGQSKRERKERERDDKTIADAAKRY